MRARTTSATSARSVAPGAMSISSVPAGPRRRTLFAPCARRTRVLLGRTCLLGVVRARTGCVLGAACAAWASMLARRARRARTRSVRRVPLVQLANTRPGCAHPRRTRCALGVGRAGLARTRLGLARSHRTRGARRAVRAGTASMLGRRARRAGWSRRTRCAGRAGRAWPGRTCLVVVARVLGGARTARCASPGSLCRAIARVGARGATGFAVRAWRRGRA